MKLRNKLSLSYTLVFISLLGATFISIYFMSKKNRENEFHQRFMEKALASFRLITELGSLDDNVLAKLDKNLVNGLRENTFLFDSASKLIYSSTSGITPGYVDNIVSRARDKSVIFQPYGSGELIGLKFTNRGKTYFGIAQADDRVGKETMRFLEILLLFSFFTSVAIIILLSSYLARLITSPITRLTREIENISPGEMSGRVVQKKGNDEIIYLASKFNQMLDEVEKSFKFQHLFINHLSHELKTPLAIMMANAERSLTEDEILRSSMQFQKNAIMELSHIINALLDIAKTEKNIHVVNSESIRVDEIVFECMDEMTILNSGLRFDFNIDSSLDERKLTILGNSRMIKMAVMNLIKNAVNFSREENPSIEITESKKDLHIIISNDGDLIEPDEQAKLFKHLFRGKNSSSIKGFGLGLVLAHRIISLHNGQIQYLIHANKRNCFHLSLPTIS